jgi:GH24 family phage-related lysozyme (muramidase)
LPDFGAIVALRPLRPAPGAGYRSGGGMPTPNRLTLSKEGREALEHHEASINGLYDDPSGYATYGVGHLVQKFKSVLLQTAMDERLCTSRVKVRWPNTQAATPYLEREALGCKDFAELTTRAAARAPAIVAQARYRKDVKDLTEAQRASVTAAARTAVATETYLLNTPVDTQLAVDVRPFEKTVNRNVTGVALTQGEFDALVSLTFNIGPDNFESSTLLELINEDRHRSGEAGQREKAIEAIERAFLAWSKSNGVTQPILVKRRRAEADTFLATARAQLVALKRQKHMPPPKSPR